jgi:hypothetical protein
VNEFATDRWRRILACNGLAGFEDVWSLDHVWVQPPNTRHRGFGGVARHDFALPEGGRSTFYVKIHRNRLRRTLTKPWRATPALARELANHARCTAAGVANPTPLYCASRRVRGEQRGIFVTEALHGFRSLRELLDAGRSASGPGPQLRRRVIDAIALQLRALHAARLVARSYTPDHVFVRIVEATASEDTAPRAEVEVRLIDLERVKRTALRRHARMRDLVALQSATEDVSDVERLRFFLRYLGIDSLTPAAKRLWRRVAAECAAKRRRRGQSVSKG